MSIGCCERCIILLDAYRDSTRYLGALSKRLADAAIGKEIDMFMGILDEVIEAQRKCANVREEVLLHLATHSSP